LRGRVNEKLAEKLYLLELLHLAPANHIQVENMQIQVLQVGYGQQEVF
jgi:hypothetical protein